MAVFKCKMCGGELEIESGASVGVCQYCGTKQTLPRLDDDRRANLYDRANHFRRNNDFDKAAGIYERILNEDPADAEAYWSLVLCRYGIEYVEDPKTHKRHPTVNRAQFTSIFDDEDYKAALSHADTAQKAVYEEEAAAINEIQKGILAISQKETPFDVFICYKETDANGRRTPDSVLANDLYHQLTQEGFKVFFSRITLEDKLGVAYEPYIFAALNSAKVMVVLGTRPEYFNAVWVKNEWSRYLSLVKASGGKKVLIPAYRDMDPYDLPEEFSHLQAQDMSKLGFMQDLIRGIKKIAKADEPKTAVKETVVVGGNANTAPLLRRAAMFLEDGEWDRADDFCEQVLNTEPENAQAYVYKLMAELKVHTQAALADCAEPFDDKNNYRKAIRFGGKALASELSGYTEHIKERNENARLNNAYLHALRVMNGATNEAAYQEAAGMFRLISGYRDADARARQCFEKAEQCRKQKEVDRKNNIYLSAKKHMETGGITGYTAAIQNFQQISGWKDVDILIEACQRKIEEIKAKEEAERLERERQTEEKRIAAEKAAKKKKITIAIATPIVVACIAFVIVLTTVIIPNQKYNAAVELYNSGNYEDAIAAFTALNGYKDSTAQIEVCQTAIKEQAYNEAIALIDSGNYITAYLLLSEMNYKDSSQLQISITPQYHEALLANSNVGSYVFFGSYEQDYNSANGKEDIEWLVLAKEDNRILVISKYALDCQPYNTSNISVNWQTCTLRKWLNNTFLKDAFTYEEQLRIPHVRVDTVTDQVFVLSSEEARKYFINDSARQCTATTYCDLNGTYTGANNSGWWLRSPGRESNYAALVYFDGSVRSDGHYVNWEHDAVRPAMWIDLG